MGLPPPDHFDTADSIIVDPSEPVNTVRKSDRVSGEPSGVPFPEQGRARIPAFQRHPRTDGMTGRREPGEQSGTGAHNSINMNQQFLNLHGIQT
ncbi:MAG: hypothetical protein IJH79_16065 [Lentisphaeria bacterium]|nr:hypothetical protein [Lentisphaeria bacterium]